MRYAEVPLAVQTGRVVSVDALRGFNIFWILGADGGIWVLERMLHDKGPDLNSIGSFLKTQMSHAAWEGFRFYDFIFPLFIFVTGVSIVLALPRLVERDGKAKTHLRVLRRALLLYALGVIFYGGVGQHWSDIRYVGVLQRIAICYLFASLLFLNLGIRGLVVALVVLLGGYWALMTFVPVPGIGAGSFGPDANLANWIDAHYLPGRLWDKTRDPEGLLSTLPAIGTCLFGVLAGLLLKDDRLTPTQRSLWLIGGGIVDGWRRLSVGTAIPDYQGDLDIVVCAGCQRLQRDPARRYAPGDRCVGMEGLGDRLRMDRRQRHHALFH